MGLALKTTLVLLVEIWEWYWSREDKDLITSEISAIDITC